jgi:hypothetical protein
MTKKIHGQLQKNKASSCCEHSESRKWAGQTNLF